MLQMRRPLHANQAAPDGQGITVSGPQPEIVPEFLFCLSVGPLDVQIKLCIAESAGTRRFPSRISLVFEVLYQISQSRILSGFLLLLGLDFLGLLCPCIPKRSTYSILR
jgi:hypothetical protein